jgi:hypothetical protein
MKGKELLAELAGMTDAQLELDVRVQADHGQSAMPAQQVSVAYIEAEEDYMTHVLDMDDVDTDSVAIILIED